jgi:hypothetical protein
MTARLLRNAHGLAEGEVVPVVGYFPLLGCVRVKREGDQYSRMVKLADVEVHGVDPLWEKWRQDFLEASRAANEAAASAILRCHAPRDQFAEDDDGA